MPKKTIDIHLMDMMCGWSEFVAEENEENKDQSTINQTYQFYQEVSGAMLNMKTQVEKEIYLREFLTYKVMPFILKNSREDENNDG